MEREFRETKLTGEAICLVKEEGSLSDKVVITHLTVPAIYYPDWQCDAHSWHDEGNFEYDLENAQVTYPDEYKVIHIDGTITEGDKKIVRLIKIIKEDLSEV